MLLKLSMPHFKFCWSVKLLRYDADYRRANISGGCYGGFGLQAVKHIPLPLAVRYIFIFCYTRCFGQLCFYTLQTLQHQVVVCVEF